jgi:hypothetical protein
MTSDARAWLAERSDDVPASLQSRMEQSARDATGVTIPDALASASLDALRDALALCDDRAAALPLLAADALITAACEAAADDEAALAALCAAFDPSRLAALVHPAPQ